MKLSQVIKKWNHVADHMADVQRDAAAEVFTLYANTFANIAFDALMDKVPNAAESEAMIRSFCQTFTAENQFPVLRFMLRPVSGGEPSPSGPTAIPISTGEITADDIEHWVRTGAETGSQDNTAGKVIDGRDGDIDDVVRKMQGILIFSNGDIPSHKSAREKYLPAIRQFITSQRSSQSADWLASHGPTVVLAAWVSRVRRTWPSTALKYLKKLTHAKG